MNEPDMKREDRTSLNVSVETRDMILELLYEQQAVRKQRCTQDDIVRFLLNFYHTKQGVK